MGTVTMSTYNGIDMCQKQFFDRRWNCSSLTKVPKLTKDLKRGTQNTGLSCLVFHPFISYKSCKKKKKKKNKIKDLKRVMYNTAIELPYISPILLKKFKINQISLPLYAWWTLLPV